MDRLEFLIRRFRQIVPQPLTGWDPVRSRRLRCWLKDDVGPVLDNFVKRPRFRALAAWSVRTLRPGCGTAERLLVEQVDAALVAQGQALCQIAGRPHIRKRLEAVAVEHLVTEEEVRLGSGGPQLIRRVESPVDRLAIVLVQLGQIAGRFWNDLVCLEDYFEPIGGWMTRQCSDTADGEFIVALNPELHPGGDFISRCLCRRIEVMLEVLTDFQRLGDKAFRLPRARTPKGWEEVNERHRHLSQLAEQLRYVCLQIDQQPLREACILLTQVYAVLCPSADLSWLGLPATMRQRATLVMGHRLQSCHAELLERLAASLGELKKLYADTDDQQSAVEEALASGGLVIVRSRQDVCWEGTRIEVNWSGHHAIWRFLQVLAEKGQHGAVVEECDLYTHVTARSTLATTFSRLKKLVPASLWKLIVPSKDPRGYRLVLDCQHIHLF